MDHPLLARVVIGVGALLALFSLFPGPLGLERQPGFGWLQGLGLILGVVVILAGVYLRRRKASP